ncbi:MAG TPA: PilZ domain-containing protein [Acidisarcina sp.]|nr:PilZ domain-containing protein [Acidisarcina sp.]
MVSFKNWFQKLLTPDRRRAERHQSPQLVAFYWNGTPPLGHDVRDISSTGLYLKTEDRWYPGTLVTMTLQQTGTPVVGSEQAIAVDAKVVRFGEDGVGLAFVVAEKPTMPNKTDKKTLGKFLQHLQECKGQALIEYILLLPLLFLLVVNVVNFGGFFFAWITVANAARAGVNYGILGGASVGPVSTPSASMINSLITQDISSLLNRSSLVVSICQQNNGLITTLQGTCASVPADPEPGAYVLTTVDVTYTYRPFIPAGFQFPNLNIYATIPPTTVHRRAVMRSIQ